jgi:hypothetical protein
MTMPGKTYVELVLCRSVRGEWSLHAPDASDAAIANGHAPPLLSGPADWNEKTKVWSRPNKDDYDEGWRIHEKR